MQNKSETLEPNIPCKNCRRSSNLKCIWCDTIYCSVGCQFQDWKEHEHSCLKSKGIVSKLTLVKHPVKCSNGVLNSHSVKELDIVNKKKLEYAERLKKPTNSVQQRLKDACTRDYKVQPFVPVQYPVDVVNRESKQHELIKKEINSPPFSPKVQPFVPVQYPVDVVNRESKQHKLIKKEINSPPFSPKDDPNRLIDLFNKVKSKRNWKQYEIPKQVDKDGYFKAIITDFSKGKLGGQSYIVSPVDLKDQYLAHLRQLQQVYKSTVVESLSRDKIEKNDLVVALIGITWHRATVLEVDDKMVVVRSIETGCNCFIKDFSKIKAPLPSELQKKAFIIEVTFENDYSIDINSIVSIKILSDMSETILATMKLDNEVIEIEDSDSDAFEDELVEKIEAISRGPEKRNVLIDFEETKLTKVSATSLDAKCKSIDERKYLNSQMIKDFHTGDNIKLTFLDGSELTKGIAHFCELNAENVDFYLKIDTEIKYYVTNNVDQGNYKPVLNELVLAKFNDGLYYRGVCKNIKDRIALINFLDYGGSENVEIDTIMKLPITLLYTFCSHTCRVKITEGEISELNTAATVNKLFDQQNFACNVTKLNNDSYPYQLTIDKSLVVFS